MPHFVVSFYSDSHGLVSQLIECASADAAIREFFDHHQGDYTKNEEGFSYFREDFSDPEKPMGSVIAVD